MPSKASILNVLSGECPAIDTIRTKPGTNTTSTYWPDVDTWTRWDEFNAQNLYTIYQSVVDAEWVSGAAGSVDPSSWDTRVFDEDSLEHYLSKFLLPPVNAALGHARHVLDMDKEDDLNVGRGGRCYYGGGDTTRLFKPDWSLCSDSQSQDSKLYKNLLPGDTKVAIKWQSSMHKTAAHYAWKDPVRQILYYMTEVKVRYGWLITDAELVVLRVSLELTGSGQAADRPKRELGSAALGHSRMSSSETDLSRLSSALQSVSLSNSIYTPQDDGVEAYRVEYQAIPWKSSGPQLSIRLALFYLAMMAGYGSHSILPAYPAFDSHWWSDAHAELFVHNTTGFPSKIPRNLEHPDPTGQRGPEIKAFTSGTGRPGTFLTRASVRTLAIDLQREQPYYDVEEPDEEGKMVSCRIFVDDNVTIYDADTGQHGRLRGLRWVPDAEESGDSREGKRSLKEHSGSGKRHKK